MHARPRSALLALAAGLALATSSCAMGEPPPAETAQAEVSGGAIGPDVRVSPDLDLLQVQLALPEDGVYSVGEDAPLTGSVSNTGRTPVELTAVRSAGFAGSSGDLPLTVPPGATVAFGPAEAPTVVLTGAQRELRSAQSVPVTFTLGDAGEVTLDVPVMADRPAVATPTA